MVLGLAVPVFSMYYLFRILQRIAEAPRRSAVSPCGTTIPMLTLKIFVIILAVLAAIHVIGEWVDRRKRQKRTAALKDWMHKQDKPPTVIYRKVEIRLAHQRQPD
jgi:hypothetical protein